MDFSKMARVSPIHMFFLQCDPDTAAIKQWALCPLPLTWEDLCDYLNQESMVGDAV